MTTDSTESSWSSSSISSLSDVSVSSYSFVPDDWWSQLVFTGPRYTSKGVSGKMLIDLCLPDQEFMKHYNGSPFIDIGGTFNGLEVESEMLRVADNVPAYVNWADTPPTQAVGAWEEWYETMVLRVRAKLNQAREEGASLSLSPFEYRNF